MVHVITGLNDGGAEAVLYRLCAHESQVTHCVVSLMDEGKYGPLLAQSGVDVVCLNIPQGRFGLSGVLRLWRLLRAQKPDVVQTWMYHANLIGGVAGAFAGIPKIFWGIRHSKLDPDISKRSTILVARLSAWFSNIIPRQIICCADKALKVHLGLGYAANKLSVIYNGYDLSRFDLNEVERLRLRNDWAIDHLCVLGMVARFDLVKDHKNFLEALNLLKKKGTNFVALLIGNEIDAGNAQILGWIQQLDLTDCVRLLGPRSDIPAVMNALDIHVLSSSAEGFPNVVAEAMACGTPAVVTDVGDASLIVGETGWVVPPSDSAALADVLEKALLAMQDPVAWEKRCHAARMRIVENFSIERMVQQYHNAWNGS